jgi:hypothetical protein
MKNGICVISSSLGLWLPRCNGLPGSLLKLDAANKMTFP